MKIVINTNNYYKIPLKHLMVSILNSGFQNFKDIIIVFSESEINEGPKLINLSELIDVNTDKQVVVIRLTLNNYDYAGFAALHLFKNHELVQ